MSDKKRNYIFAGSVTIDGRYLIICDNVYDNHQQKSIGNIWESIDIFKTIFQNVKLDNNEYNQIKEDIITLPILEGKSNLFELRDILLEFNFFDDTWVGREAKKTGQGIEEFALSSLEGLKQFGIAISQGDWTNILTMVSKGVRFILRGLKDALYSAVGMTVDAILVAVGIGKVAQIIPWALVTALDVYQLTSNDWPPEDANSPTWLKFLTLGFDILGLAATGVIAKSAKMMFEPLKSVKTIEQASMYISKNLKLKQLIQSMINGASKVPSMLSSAQKTIASKFPAGGEFLGSIMGKLGSVITSFVNTLKSLLGSKGYSATRAGVTTGGVMYGAEGVSKYMKNKGDESLIKALGNKGTYTDGIDF